MINVKAAYCRQTNCIYIGAVTPHGNILRTVPFMTDIRKFKFIKTRAIAIAMARQALHEYAGSKMNFTFKVVNDLKEV